MGKKELHFSNVGMNDQIPYTKIDITKVCRLNENFAISFYQMDYQALAYFLNDQSSMKNQEDIQVIPVLKSVMNLQSFLQLRNDINEIYNLYEKEKQNIGK
jgi:glutaredoxin-related protein